MKNVFNILNWTVSSKLALQAPFFPKNEEVQSSNIGGESNVYVAVGLGRTNNFTLRGER
jgi:hypothetical protein